MNWFSTDRVAVALSAIALIGSGFGWWRNQSAATRADKKADEARGVAERATFAAERSAKADESSAKALTALAARTTTVEAGLANVMPGQPPDWRILVPDDGPWYQLVNLGGTAYDVSVSGTAFDWSGTPAHRSVWLRGEGESFLGVDRFGLSHGTVGVSYRPSADGERLTWLSVLPVRPT